MNIIAHHSRTSLTALRHGYTSDPGSYNLDPACDLCDGAKWIERLHGGDIVPTFEGDHHAERCPICNPAPRFACDQCGEGCEVRIMAIDDGVEVRRCPACLAEYLSATPELAFVRKLF